MPENPVNEVVLPSYGKEKSYPHYYGRMGPGQG
jgi:hypothetical protein